MKVSPTCPCLLPLVSMWDLFQLKDSPRPPPLSPTNPVLPQIMSNYTKNVPVSFTVSPDVAPDVVTDGEWAWQMVRATSQVIDQKPMFFELVLFYSRAKEGLIVHSGFVCHNVCFQRGGYIQTFARRVR